MILNKMLPLIIGMLITFSIVTSSFSDPLSRNAYFILSYLSVIISFFVFFNKKNRLKYQSAMIISITFLLFGISRVAWSFLVNEDGLSIYKSYSATSSRIILSSFIFFVVIIFRDKLFVFFKNNYISAIIKVLPLYIFIYALYEIFVLGKYRVEMSTHRATGIAYLTSSIFFLSLYFCSDIKNKFDSFFYFTILIVSNLTIFLTQTRSAIVIYLLLSVFYTIFVFRDKLSIIKVIFIFLCLIMLSGGSYKFLYKERINEAITETQQYDVTKPGGSLGDRYTMWYAGLSALKHAPFGQSVHSRNDFISEKIAAGKISDSITVYLTVSLHNELIDVLSLQGVIGGLLLIFIYFSLMYVSIRNKNILLLMITLCLAGYGLTDVLFFSREVITVYMLCIAVALVTGGKEDTAEQPLPIDR
ncbi:O-antigen ligase family protein [Morganella morganii]|uniref:O-antigen ligase family protein n=1 Tax=Morganella morganii TaxID=582 RepID=UPI00319EDE3E